MLPDSFSPSPGFRVLYEDKACVVVCKEAGLLTQAPVGIPSLEQEVKAYLQPDASVPVYLGVPHRLDRASSGIVVFGKTRTAARQLAEQFQQKTVTKKYWALVEGQPDQAEGAWNDWMRKVDDEPRAEIVAEDHPQAKLAQLNYRVLASREECSLLEIELLTGRMHQIRLQCGSRGHAILGDSLYGANTPFGEQHADERLRAIALHAVELSFHRPDSQKPLTIRCEPEGAWVSLLAQQMTARSASEGIRADG